MGIGFKMGGSGRELAFRIVAYASEADLNAASPAEGTLGIVTGSPVTGWSIQPEAPADPPAGHLWIRTGTSSLGSFNALLRNRLAVYPVGAKQWTGEGWADRVGKTYVNGWKSWEPETAYLYRAWDQNSALTGGWSGTDGCLDLTSGTLAVTAQRLGGSVSYGAACTLSPVELTPWQRMTLTVTGVDGASDSERYFAVFREAPNGQPGEEIAGKLLLSLPVPGAGTYALDLSGITGAYRVGFYVNGYGYNRASLTATEVKLEKEVIS